MLGDQTCQPCCNTMTPVMSASLNGATRHSMSLQTLKVQYDISGFRWQCLSLGLLEALL
jgi:hypothetical protein